MTSCFQEVSPKIAFAFATKEGEILSLPGWSTIRGNSSLSKGFEACITILFCITILLTRQWSLYQLIPVPHQLVHHAHNIKSLQRYILCIDTLSLTRISIQMFRDIFDRGWQAFRWFARQWTLLQATLLKSLLELGQEPP